jgi:hypothetical protein
MAQEFSLQRLLASEERSDHYGRVSMDALRGEERDKRCPAGPPKRKRPEAEPASGPGNDIVTETSLYGRLFFVGLDYFLCLQALGSLHDREFHRLSLFQGAVALGLNRGVVDEDVAALTALNKTVTLGIVEPFDFSGLSAHGLRDSFRIMGEVS